ncbi:MAG: divalent-cation tolerance protein CutA [Proteobacteria bacterium]|jgi:periplasmic divalent cation tolerance protein|nr:divalent-cation tolerance protein CutA [Pseudomonadota bacterium]
MSDYGVVFMTAASREEAETIAAALVEKKLAACVNIVSAVQSVYWWEGKICREQEVFMMAKTKTRLFPQLASEVKALHSYKVPEIIMLPISDGSADYLQWIENVTG